MKERKRGNEGGRADVVLEVCPAPLVPAHAACSAVQSVPLLFPLAHSVVRCSISIHSDIRRDAMIYIIATFAFLSVLSFSRSVGNKR